MIQEPRRKPPLYLLTGLGFGLILGLVVAWLIWPPSVGAVGPNSLDSASKDQYRLMVALSYAATGDLGRAEARLALIGDTDPVRALTAQAQVMLANSAKQREARALARLAANVEEHLAALVAATQPAGTPDPNASAATPFQSAGENATYFMDSEPELVCDSVDAPPYLKIFVFDANHNPQAGVELSINSEERNVDFITGQRPEMSPGYAEIEMTPGVVYTLSIQGVEMLGGLQPAACETEAGDPAWGSWLLLFNAEE